MAGGGEQTAAVGELEDAELLGAMKKLLKTMERLDQEIAPLLEADGSFFNARSEAGPPRPFPSPPLPVGAEEGDGLHRKLPASAASPVSLPGTWP